MDHLGSLEAPRKDPFHISTFTQSLRSRRLDKKQRPSQYLCLHQLPPPRTIRKPFEHCHALRFCPVLVDYTIHRCHWLGAPIVHTSEAHQHSLRSIKVVLPAKRQQHPLSLEVRGYIIEQSVLRCLGTYIIPSPSKSVSVLKSRTPSTKITVYLNQKTTRHLLLIAYQHTTIMFSCANYERGCRGRCNASGSRCGDCIALNLQARSSSASSTSSTDSRPVAAYSAMTSSFASLKQFNTATTRAS